MPEEKVSFPSIKDVPAEKWKRLSQKKIYFGHQSVGNNIINGIEDLMREYPREVAQVASARRILGHDTRMRESVLATG